MSALPIGSPEMTARLARITAQSANEPPAPAADLLSRLERVMKDGGSIELPGGGIYYDSDLEMDTGSYTRAGNVETVIGGMFIRVQGSSKSYFGSLAEALESL